MTNAKGTIQSMQGRKERHMFLGVVRTSSSSVVVVVVVAVIGCEEETFEKDSLDYIVPVVVAVSVPAAFEIRAPWFPLRPTRH